MPLSIFIDALPFSEIDRLYRNWVPNMQIAELQPNIAYSSSLHWQLYCDKYPDDRGKFVDWGRTPESNKSVRIIANVLRPLDCSEWLGFFVRKGFDKFIFRKNTFANIPFRFRGDFSDTAKYLFFSKETYSKEDTFKGYTVVSQDEGHYTFEQAITKLKNAVLGDNPNVFAAFGAVDSMGHQCSRGEIYDQRLKTFMDSFREVILMYAEKYPEQEIIIASDHGMSTIEHKIDLELEKQFGKQSKDTYIAYIDSCMMCVWSENDSLLEKIRNYLLSRPEGHLITDEERKYYRATDRQFGDLLFNLKEGYCFASSWFGKGLHKSPDGEGMHGFWPERSAKDQMASIILINGKRPLAEFYKYPEAYKLISTVMQGK